MAKKSQKPGPMRLQKFLSDTGVASRRRAEELIEEGRVLVNDEVVTSLPAFVDPQHDQVVVDGLRVKAQPPAYYLLHKPKGVVCTNNDPAGRLRAIDLLPPMPQRLFPVGRLDEDSTGLLLMTNDGELAEEITHPRYGVPKIYRAEVRGRVAPELVEQMRRGVWLSEGKARAAEVEIVRSTNKSSVLNITLREGRKRQVRRMLAKLGHAVRQLKRLQIGPLSVRGLPEGACRQIRPAELRELRAMLDEGRKATRAAGADRPRRRPSARTTGDDQPRGARKPRSRTGRGGQGSGQDPGAGGRRIIS